MNNSEIVVDALVRVSLGIHKGKHCRVAGIGLSGHPGHDLIALLDQGFPTHYDPIFVFRMQCELLAPPAPPAKRELQVGDRVRVVSGAGVGRIGGLGTIVLILLRGHYSYYPYTIEWDNPEWNATTPLHRGGQLGELFQEGALEFISPPLQPIVCRPGPVATAERVCRFREGDTVRVTQPALSRHGQAGRIVSVHLDPTSADAFRGGAPLLHARYVVAFVVPNLSPYAPFVESKVTFWDNELSPAPQPPARHS